MITHEVSGILVPPAEPHQIAAAVLRILRDPALAGRLSAGAGSRAQPYSIEAMMAEIHALYRELLAGNRRAAARHGRSSSAHPAFT